MARQKKQVKFKEPVRIRTKPLSNGNRSIFLDVYYYCPLNHKKSSPTS